MGGVAFDCFEENATERDKPDSRSSTTTLKDTKFATEIEIREWTSEETL